MSWITISDLASVFPAVTSTEPDDLEALMAHVQGLAEVEIGTQTEPVTNKLKAVMVDVAYRAWRARTASAVNPSGYQSEQIDDYRYENPTGFTMEAGFGLTKLEARKLKKAAGQSTLWVQPVTRGDLETAGPLPAFEDDDLTELT